MITGILFTMNIAGGMDHLGRLDKLFAYTFTVLSDAILLMMILL